MTLDAIRARNVLLLVCTFALAACGFHLRGVTDLAFKSIYIQESSKTKIVKDLRRSLTSSGIVLAVAPEQADLQLDLMGETNDKRILSLSGGGKVREYELIYRVTLRLRDAGSELWGAPQVVEVRRDFSYDDTQLLAKEGEEARLYKDMHSDAAREIMRRLNAIKTAKPGAAN